MSIEKRKVSRRSFLGTVMGGAAVGAVGIIAGSQRAEAQVTDSDSGASADPPGGGRGRRTGVTDRDASDPRGNGRGRRSSRYQTLGPGRQPTGITDSNPFDRPGYGRGVRCGDSDPSDRC